jgi:hypothetical protein
MTGVSAGYTMDLSFFAHVVGKNNEDIKALTMAADEFGDSGILIQNRTG